MWAAYWGQYDVVEYLLESGADKTLTNKAGKTAEKLAAERGNRLSMVLIRNWS